jgi:hypothetical protein
MLESMIHDAIPTRAEATDVANAILDGTDAIMLSGETTIGDYPIESLVMMDRIARTTESAGWRVRTEADAGATGLSIGRSIGRAVCQLACDLNAAKHGNGRLDVPPGNSDHRDNTGRSDVLEACAYMGRYPAPNPCGGDD